jgi:hypothetical protein
MTLSRAIDPRRPSVLAVLLLAFAPLWSFGQTEAGEGERLYELKCGRCHAAYLPQKYSVEEWKTVFVDMGPLAGLDARSEEAILVYLERKTAGTAKRGLPTSPVLAGYLYTEFFSSKDAVDTFDMHYLNFNVAGRLHERVSYRAEFELEHGGGRTDPPFVEQAYLDLRLARSLAVRVGAILTPFNRFDEFHGPLENFLVNRPQMAREVGVSAWKDVGVDVHGTLFLGKSVYLNYDLYLINGLGAGTRLRTSRQYLDNNDAKSFGVRLSGVLSDRWEVGLSVHRGAWDAGGDYDLTLAGVHVLGKVGELSLFGEYAQALSENPPPAGRGKASGYFLQASYLFDRKFRPTVQFGTLDYLDAGTLLGRRPTDLDANAFALGLNYYLTPAIVFKVEYDFVGEGPRKAKTSNDLFALQAAVRF